MTEPLVIVCVKWGERYGSYYVNTLYDMVRRNLPQGLDYAFQCFTDDPAGLNPKITARELPGALTGWWNKLYLFKKGIFDEGKRIIYFDLDTLITGSLAGLIQYRSDFAILRDFYRPNGYCSAVMFWRGGMHHHIWESFDTAGKPNLQGGDQAWIEKVHTGAELLQDVFPGAFASFKVDCHPLPPEGTSVVCFHGEPKQDNCDATWVREVWKKDGIYKPVSAYPTVQEDQLAYARLATELPYPWLKHTPAHTRHAVIIGGGSSLDECREELRRNQEEGYDLFAINDVPAWLTQNGIGFDAHVMCNASKEHVAFMPEADVPCYYASTCHPATFAKAGGRAILWHPELNGLIVNLKDFVKGGSTTGLKAIYLTYMLGYRNFHLYGFDSCYLERAHHAYIQPESGRNRVFTTELYGRQFRAAIWMMKQADEFIELADMLLLQGCSITIHGDGLLHFLATHIQRNNRA